MDRYMKPSDLRQLTEQAKHKAVEDQHLEAVQNQQTNQEYIETWYAFYLRIMPSILVEAANKGLNEALVFSWATDDFHRHVAENQEIATRLDATLREDGHSVSYRDDMYQSSYDAPVEHCRSLMVSW